MKLTKLTTASVFAIAAMMLTAPAHAKECKEMAQSACDSSDTCSWVKAHTRSDGAKVKAFCRAKPGNGSKSSKSSSKSTKKSDSSSKSASKADDTKKSDSKSKAKDTAKKTTKKADSKAKDTAKKAKSKSKDTAKKAKKKKADKSS